LSDFTTTGQQPAAGIAAQSPTILVVDDNEMNRDLLVRRLVRNGYRTETAENGLQALDVLQRADIDLVLLDIAMPALDGYEVLKRMKFQKSFVHIPVIMISANDQLDSVTRCIELGADDYLTKPFEPLILKARISSCLNKKHLRDLEKAHQKAILKMNEQLSQRVSEQVKEITSAQLAAIFSMSKLAESKDPETGAHLERMREYCKVLSERLSGLDEYKVILDREYIDTIYAASPLHDIGKVGVPDDILLKPGKLTPEEWKIMRTHTTIGAETLRAVDRQHPGSIFIRIGIEISESHHEKWDGSGYPYGLKGKDIPLSARILTLGDVYDALTSVRCYKEAFDHASSLEIIRQGAGKHFDPEVVDAFLEKETEFVRIRKELHDSDDVAV